MIPTADNPEVNAAMARVRKALGIPEPTGRIPVGFPGAGRAVHAHQWDESKYRRKLKGTHGGGQFTRKPGTDGKPGETSDGYKRHNPKPETTGTGTREDPIKTNEVDVAARALSEDKYVELTSTREVSTLLDKLAAIVDDAKAKGDAAPEYDLCKVTVPHTNLFCADEATEILTERGWRRYDEIQVGDEVLTLNHDTGLSEWQPTSAINVFPAEPRIMLSLEGRGHSSLTTLDHRWPVLSGRHQVKERRWTTSGHLGWDDRIPVAAPAAVLPEPKYDDALVELVAWAWTEGTITGRSLRIYQSATKNPGYCAAIRGALTRLYGPATVNSRSGVTYDGPVWRETVRADTGMVSFHLNVLAAEPLLAQMDSRKVVRVDFIRALTAAQLRLFVDRSIDGDGHRGPLGETFSQRVEARNRVFELACVLLGIRVATYSHPETRPGRNPELTQHTTSLMLGSQPWIKPPIKGGLIQHAVIHDGIVWCPTTPNGTWFARRNGTSYFTGNCVENKGIPRIMMPQLKARPVPGSEADKMPKNAKGEADLSGAFVEHLKTKGINIHSAAFPPEVLKASQRQINGGKVAGMTKAMEAGKIPPEAIFVTQDDYIVDGHHRWAANVALEIKKDGAVPDMPVNVIEADIIPILAMANVFALVKGIPPAGVAAVSPRAMYDLLDRVTLRYNPSQVRVPSGKHGGGRWGTGIPAVPHKSQHEEPSFGPSTAGDPASGVGKTDTQYEMDRHIEKMQAMLAAAVNNGQATEDQYGIDVGKGIWKPERAKIHKQIVDEMWVKAASVPSEGKAVISGGLGGSGKTTVLRADPDIAQDQFLTLNADDVKEIMAEKGLIPQVDHLKPMEASTLVHTEAAHIADLLAAKAMAARKNVIVDTTMSEPRWVQPTINALRHNGYDSIEGVFVEIPLETSVQRAMNRYAQGQQTSMGGRYIPPDVIRRNASKVSSSKNRETFDQLRGQFNRSAVYDNSGTAPVLVDRVGAA